MTTKEVLATLKTYGNENTKKIHLTHGAREPVFGVKVEDLKKVLKQLKNNQQLALELYDTGNSDAMYLAGLAADGAKMTKKQLQQWAEKAYWSWLSEYIVPWVSTENPQGFELALEWIDSKKENIASTGWGTINVIISNKPDEELDIKKLKALLGRVEKEIHTAPNRVRYTMNAFVIGLGCFVKELNKEAMATAKKIGVVMVDMNGTSCKTPFAPDYIKKVMDKGKLGAKRKNIKC